MIRLRALDIADPTVAVDVLDVQRRAYRIEADLIGTDAIPPLRETVENLRGCGETFLGAFEGERIAGFVSWKFDIETIDIHRLAVDPACFRRGIGTTLVRAALAAEPGAQRWIVQTGAANEPAKTLYAREGFAEVEDRTVGDGVRVTLFEYTVGR